MVNRRSRMGMGVTNRGGGGWVGTYPTILTQSDWLIFICFYYSTVRHALI